MNTPSDLTSPRVGIVTVSYQSDDVLTEFLTSIPRATATPFQVVIVDNKPDAGNSQALARKFGADYVPMPANPGYGAAVNHGVSRLPASVEWVLISNPDVILGAGAIDLLVAAGDADELVASIGPSILNPDGSTYPSARQVPSLRTGIGHALFTNVWPNNRWSRAYLDSPGDSDRDARDAGWLSGSCMLVRRAAFEQIGGFDEGYFMYFEDVDLGYRFAKAHFVNRYLPGAHATHIGAHSTSEESAQMIEAHHRSAMRFLSRKYPGALLWPVRWGLRFGLSVRSALAKRRARKFSRSSRG